MHNETRKYVSSDSHQTSLAGVGCPSVVRSHVRRWGWGVGGGGPYLVRSHVRGGGGMVTWGPLPCGQTDTTETGRFRRYV